MMFLKQEIWSFLLNFFNSFCPGTSRDRGFCPGTFAPALVPGQRDARTRFFLSRDKGTQDLSTFIRNSSSVSNSGGNRSRTGSQDQMFHVVLITRGKSIYFFWGNPQSQALSKIGYDFSNKVISKLKLPKNRFSKK